MTLLNFSIIHTFFLLFVFLTVVTATRRHLTYKGVQLLLTFGSAILVGYCTIVWKEFVLKHNLEVFALKLNPNTWTGVVYELNFKINDLTFLFIFLVSIIGFATNIYILNYFKYEERSEEFALLINWFILSMVLLVSGNNFFTLILGWELIGLTSFLLINFWKFKVTTLACSFKAFTFNKVSDLFMIISFCILWNSYKINNVDALLSVLTLNKGFTNKPLFWSAISLLLCSSIKSAQLFGHLWLPDSMEAPVPASSLIHSATLVSAGIYLILKFQYMFVATGLLKVIFFLGSITACYGGIVAAAQTDVKKLLAYSTISHCGFIFATIALNNYAVTVVYLYMHGFFKAVTFFCVGSLIKYSNSQDTRAMGMLKSQLVNSATLFLASINLGALPFTFGYMYKQTFLICLVNAHFDILSYGFCIVGMLTSLVYVYKLNYYSCFDVRKGVLQVTVLILQNTKQSNKNNFLNFTHLKLAAFSVLFLYATFFFLTANFYVLQYYLYTSSSPEIVVNELPYIVKYTTMKSYQTSMYYTLFVLTALILLLSNWRTNYFFLQKFTFIAQVLVLLTGLYFVNNFLKYLVFFI